LRLRFELIAGDFPHSVLAAVPRPSTVVTEESLAVVAIEIRKLGYSSAAGGHENQLLELSDRMIQRADNLGTGTVH
jgi:hypothetical protein